MNNKKTKFTNPTSNIRGLTLIALIITIIIILILVGVTVSTVINSGLLKHAKDAAQKWEDATQNEYDALAQLEDEFLKEVSKWKKIPIVTSEQLLKVGTGENVEVNGILYYFGEQVNYVLQNDIEYTGSYDRIAELIENKKIALDGQSYQIIVTTENGETEYYTEDSKYYIATNKQGYVSRGLELYYDGIDNAGEGVHSNTATVWKDLSGNNRDGILNNFGTSAISGWNNEYLSFDGVNDWVNCGELNNENVTLEAVHMLKSNTNVERCIFGNWETGRNWDRNARRNSRCIFIF